MMSRPVAGVRNKSLILTLPGSVKGAKENLEAVIDVLPHACIQAAGADSRALHAGGVKKLEAEAGVGPRGGHHHHHHHHHHGGGHVVPKPHTRPEDRPVSNDPSAGPTGRHRKSPYPMISVDEALAIIERETPSPEVEKLPVKEDLVGRVLAEDVYANESVPAYRASIVDGYAVIAKDTRPNTKGVFPVAHVSHAEPSSTPLPPLKPGEIARVTTGAPLPPDANAVVMVEDTVVKSTTEDGKEEATVEILTDDIKPGENVREPGSDVTKGSKILSKGDVLSAVGGEIGLLASTGNQQVNVYSKPIVGVLSTGDELVRHDDGRVLAYGQIRDSNRPALISCLTAWGFEAVDLGIVSDSSKDLETILRDALRGTTSHPAVDVIVTTGGVSMGERDLLKPTIERQLGGTIHFGRVAMKPGKPTTFATVPLKDPPTQRNKAVIFALPGNPASALVTMHLFVLPALHKLMGFSHPGSSTDDKPSRGLPRVNVELAHSIPLDAKRTEYHRAVVTVSRDGRLRASSTGLEGVGQRSSRVASMAKANALLVMPPGEGSLPEGQLVEALMMGQIVPGN